MSKPLVSVIITTKNSSLTLIALLESIKAQSYKSIEVILVDNNSSDDTVSIAKKYTQRVFQKGPERSAQRNYGAKMSKGEYLLFLDSDMELSKSVVKDCVEPYKGDDKKIGGIIIPERSFGLGLWSKAKILEREINRGEEYFEAARFFPKKIFFSVGGYDEKLTGPEDWDFPQRVVKEYKISAIKSFILHNEGKLSLKTLAKKKYYYGLSVHQYLEKQNIPVLSPKTIYFFRKGFYKNWRMLIDNPLVTVAMIIMLTIELYFGGLGYLRGRFRKI